MREPQQAKLQRVFAEKEEEKAMQVHQPKRMTAFSGSKMADAQEETTASLTTIKRRNQLAESKAVDQKEEEKAKGKESPNVQSAPRAKAMQVHQPESRFQEAKERTPIPPAFEAVSRGTGMFRT